MQDTGLKSYTYAKFNGTTGQYYRIWLVNIILTILTFGIYSAWAKVRRIKFFLGSTEYDGSYFDFHGSPVAILRGRILLVVMFALYVGITKIHPLAVPISGFIIFLLIPLLFIKSLEFRTRYTSFKNLRFSFRGSIKEGYGIWVKFFIFPLLLVLATGFFMAQLGITDAKKITPEQTRMLLLSFVPYGIALLYFLLMFHRIFNAIISFVFNNLYFGDTPMSLNSDKNLVLKELYLKWLKVMFFILIIFCFMIFGVGFGAVKFKEYLGQASGLIMGGSFILSYLLFGAGFLYFNYLTLKYIWSRILIDKKYTSSFKLNFKEYLSIMITNVIVLGFTLGLAYPWAAVRYQKMLIEARGTNIDNFDDFTGTDLDSKSAIGEELSDGLDLGFEFGF